MNDYSSWFSLTAALERLERDVSERLMYVEQQIEERKEVTASSPVGEWL